MNQEYSVFLLIGWNIKRKIIQLAQKSSDKKSIKIFILILFKKKTEKNSPRFHVNFIYYFIIELNILF